MVLRACYSQRLSQGPAAAQQRMAEVYQAVQEPFNMVCLDSLPVSILPCSSLTQLMWSFIHQLTQPLLKFSPLDNQTERLAGSLVASTFRCITFLPLSCRTRSLSAVLAGGSVYQTIKLSACVQQVGHAIFICISWSAGQMGDAEQQAEGGAG